MSLLNGAPPETPISVTQRPKELRPWTDADLIYVRGYVIDRRTGEVVSSLLADHFRELGR